MRWRSFSWRNFPASKVANIRKGIYGIRQMNGESIYEFWERFKKLCASCPYHHISKQLLIWYFYEGLMPMEQSMIDAANRRALVDKTPWQARVLISNMATNSQQFSTQAELLVRKVNEVSTSSTLEQQIVNLILVVQQLAMGGSQQVIRCRSDSCKTLYEDGSCERVNAMGGF